MKLEIVKDFCKDPETGDWLIHFILIFFAYLYRQSGMTRASVVW